MEIFITRMKYLINNFDKEYEIEVAKCNTESDIINALENKITSDWENKIQEEKLKSYVTDDVENRFKEFTEKCIEIIIIEFNKLLKDNNDALKRLLSHRHFGYGFYTVYENFPRIKKDCELILEDNEYSKILYMSL